MKSPAFETMACNPQVLTMTAGRAAPIELMKPIPAEDYPFVKEFLIDNSGRVRKVILQLEDYQRLLEFIESQGLHRAMQDVKHETPLGLDAALQVLDAEEI